MRLEIADFPVTQVSFASTTGLQKGLLEIDQEELVGLALQDGRTPWASVDIARPGESVRLINQRDLFQPQIKVIGPGTAYPGVCGRPMTTVGQGRTHRLSNVAVMLCVDNSGLTPAEKSWPSRVEQAERGSIHSAPAAERVQAGFLDMSGPGNLPPYDDLTLICVTLEAPRGEGEERNVAISAAALRIVDRLAQVTLDLEPRETEVFDFTSTDRSLPGFVFIPHLASAEWHAGARSSAGTAVYGQTRLSAPWLLYPTEMMDGAVFGTYQSPRVATWQLSNNPVNMGLARKHGVSCNFLGCIIQRSNWTTQPEKEMAASRAALLAKQLGAVGAIVTTDMRGQRFLETALTVQACERLGISTVLLTEEEDNEGGAAPPLLVSFPEIQSVVSAGTGGVEMPFPPVERVLGARQVDEGWFDEQPPIHGSYGASYNADYYGFGRASFEDF